MAVFQFNYRDDGPWSDTGEDLSTGLCFWLTVPLLPVSMFMGFVHWKHDEARRKRAPAAASAAAAGANRISPDDARSSVAAAASVEDNGGGRTSTSTAAAAGTLPRSVNLPPLPPPVSVRSSVPEDRLYSDNLRSAHASLSENQSVRPGQRDKTRRGDLSFLDRVSEYTLPPVRGGRVPASAPPSYGDAMRGDYLVMPPPPTVAVAHCPFADNNAYSS